MKNNNFTNEYFYDSFLEAESGMTERQTKKKKDTIRGKKIIRERWRDTFDNWDGWKRRKKINGKNTPHRTVYLLIKLWIMIYYA